MPMIQNSSENPTRVNGFIGEKEVMEELGRIPTLADWLIRIQPESHSG